MFGIVGHERGTAHVDQGNIDLSRTAAARFDNLAIIANQNRGRYRRRVDANDISMYVENELEQMETRVRRTQRTELSAFKHIPMSVGNISPGARSVGYKQMTSSGKAAWIGSKTTTLERVSVGSKKFTSPTRMFGLATGWDFEDILEGMFSGQSLPNEEALAARRAYDEFLNAVAWWGNDPDITKDAEEKWYGLLNFPGIARPTTTVSISVASTPKEILDMLRFHANAIVTDTKDVEKPTRLLMPIAEYDYINETEISSDNDTTILERFLGRQKYIKEVDSCVELAGAGPNGEDIMIFFDPAPDKLNFDVTLAMTMLQLQMRGLEYIQPIVAKVLRLRVFAPRSIRIVLLPTS